MEQKLKSFVDSRPLSVLIAFGTLALSFLNSLRMIALIPTILEGRRTLENLAASGAPIPDSALHLFNPLMPAFATAAAAVPSFVMFAFYRSNEAGFRAYMVGAIASFALGILMGSSPLGGFLIDGALLAWLAYEIRGFNILKWVEAKIDRVDPPKDDAASAQS